MLPLDQDISFSIPSDIKFNDSPVTAENILKLLKSLGYRYIITDSDIDGHGNVTKIEQTIKHFSLQNGINSERSERLQKFKGEASAAADKLKEAVAKMLERQNNNVAADAPPDVDRLQTGPTTGMPADAKYACPMETILFVVSP